MEIIDIRRCGAARAGVVAILAGLVGACAQQTDPAPVILRGDAAQVFTPMPALAPSPALHLTVKRGQTLDGYAYTYHVSKSAIIAANGLHPPYELHAGMRLTIPSSGGYAGAAIRPGPSAPAAHIVEVTPLPSPHPPVPQPPSSPQTISLTPPQTAASPPAATRAEPAVIPLDGPPPPKQAAASPPPATLTPPSASSAPPPASADAAPVGGRFSWPVRGRILAGYGNMPGGGHNDGINIGAPRGTPVRAIDGGTVAYTGNEVKGYGNIVLIRHANGWISAYAHLDDVGVKPGDAIAPGQVIGKVGESGGVPEPQLHFELRRGKKPVDPKEFLAPAPSAEGPAGNKAG